MDHSLGRFGIAVTARPGRLIWSRSVSRPQDEEADKIRDQRKAAAKQAEKRAEAAAANGEAAAAEEEKKADPPPVVTFVDTLFGVLAQPPPRQCQVMADPHVPAP